MRRTGPRSPRAFGALLALSLVAGLACENSPLQTDDDHPDINGFTIVRNGEMLVRVTAAGVQGSIALRAGASLGVAVVVFDRDDSTVLLEADEYIVVEVADPAVAVFDHSTPKASSGSFRGLRAGTTSFEVRLLHGDPAHTDYFSPPIPLLVTP